MSQQTSHVSAWRSYIARLTSTLPWPVTFAVRDDVLSPPTGLALVKATMRVPHNVEGDTIVVSANQATEWTNEADAAAVIVTLVTNLAIHEVRENVWLDGKLLDDPHRKAA